MTVDLTPALDEPFVGVSPEQVGRPDLVRGKVRDIVDLDGEHLALIATDRLSAFDHVLGAVPYRGQVLNELAAWWFERVTDVVASHLVEVIDPNVTVARRCHPLPVEVVVRAHLSGSTSTALWTMYAAGERELYGVELPDGMAKNDPLDEPIITPTTKAAAGGHDTPITEAEIVDSGLVDSARWAEVRQVALAVFERGRSIASDAGLVLVDTKYEFGLDDRDRLVIIDEVHTPDSSRFWRADTAEERRESGREPENLDKEVVRLAYAEQGYRGDGEPPPLDRQLAVHAAETYLEAFSALTGRPLEPGHYPAADRVAAAVRSWAPPP